jgi:hypothetical protein
MEIPKLKRTLLYLSLLIAASSYASGQALPAAARSGDLQVGGDFSFALPDYTPQDALGYGIYSTFDLTEHYGAEVDFHQLSISQHSPAYERSYEIGARYHRDYGIYRPYVKVLVGRGVFNFPSYFDPGTSAGNLAYNLYAVGGGVDIAIRPTINVRADLEYQSWFSGPGLENGLTPTLLSIGVAYHFNAGWPR